MKSRDTLIIFVKYPQAGRVKRRLAESIGNNLAASLYRLFAEAVLKRTGNRHFKRLVFYSPPNKKNRIRSWIGKKYEIYPQKGRDLGKRMAGAFQLAFNSGAGRVVVIGTDSPLIDKDIILKAFRKLRNNQVVLGPSQDGGYYLLGLSGFYEEIFKDIDWSTDKVFKQTLKFMRQRGLKHSLLSEHFDIDNIHDLRLLKSRLRKDKKQNPAGLNSIIKAIDQIELF